ncbi:MAG: hypothetical protein AAGA90_16250 [Actinomycetota bacterium]
MTRAVSNLLIVLLMATTVTAVLAFSSNTAQFESPPGETTDERAEAAGGSVDGADPAETFGGRAADALKDDAEPAERPAVPSYLDPEPIDDGVEVATGVLGQTEVLDTSSESLANTGPVEASQWFVLATGVIAVGALARNAGRDHADGLLTVLP